MNDTMTYLLGGLGSFIVLVLLMILYRISNMKKSNEII